MSFIPDKYLPNLEFKGNAIEPKKTNLNLFKSGIKLATSTYVLGILIA